MPLYDYNTGYKIINRSIVEKIVKDCKYMNQSFSSELLVRSYYKGYSIKEENVLFKNRRVKRTGTPYKQLPSIILTSLKGFILLRFELLFK